MGHWKADIYVAVIVHHFGHGYLSTPHTLKSKAVHYTFPKKYIVIIPERIVNESQYSHRNIAEIQNGDMLQEKIIRDEMRLLFIEVVVILRMFIQVKI